MFLLIETPTDEFEAGSYERFSKFRDILAIHAGYDNHQHWYRENKNRIGQWKEKAGTYSEANKTKHGILLAHSDSHGFIYRRWYKQLREELKEVITELENEHFTHPDFTAVQTAEFLEKANEWTDLLSNATRRNERITFSTRYGRF